MKDLVIIGAGGMGREIYALALECIDFKVEYRIKGFIDDNLYSLDGFHGFPEILDTIDNYKICENDVFISSIGNVKTKKLCIEKILKKGGIFISLIHPNSRISSTASIGIGCIVFQNAGIGDHTNISNYVLVQASAYIGHDAKVGNYSRIDCHVVCVGGVIIEEEVTIHTSAVINHNVIVGKGATVGALSFVIRKVKENTTVYGNPAITLK